MTLGFRRAVATVPIPVLCIVTSSLIATCIFGNLVHNCRELVHDGVYRYLSKLFPVI